MKVLKWVGATLFVGILVLLIFSRAGLTHVEVRNPLEFAGGVAVFLLFLMLTLVYGHGTKE